MKNPNDSLEDQDLRRSIEQGEWKSELSGRRRRMLEAAADATFQRDARINLRLSSRDLELLKRQAVRDGLPYQTYIASVLHKVATGQR